MTKGMPEAVPPVRTDLPVLAFASQDAWCAWLAQEHAAARGLWLKLAKKGSGVASVSYQEALDVALCYGWIDGRKGALDETWWLQRFTPRGPRSKWSQINRDRASALIEAGAMRPAGLEQVQRAQADGRWAGAYAPQSTAAVPQDLAQALAAQPVAQAFFATLNSANRYAVLYGIGEAKRPETRTRRIEKFVAMLARQEKLYP
ncbi:MAG: YdeI family protein [Actinomycetota bacterium]